MNQNKVNTDEKKRTRHQDGAGERSEEGAGDPVRTDDAAKPESLWDRLIKSIG